MSKVDKTGMYPYYLSFARPIAQTRESLRYYSNRTGFKVDHIFGKNILQIWLNAMHTNDLFTLKYAYEKSKIFHKLFGIISVAYYSKTATLQKVKRLHQYLF